MNDHFELSDQEFELKFREGTFAPELFSHDAHLRLAWIHINNYGAEQATENICSQLLTFVTRLGAEKKFNKTLTGAAVKAVNHFMQKSKASTFKSFIAEFPRLKTHFKVLIESHYSKNIYSSEQAKKKFFEPDLLPFN